VPAGSKYERSPHILSLFLASSMLLFSLLGEGAPAYAATPTIQLAPSGAPAGSVVTLYGEAFVPSSSATITFGSSGTVATTTTNAFGTFQVTFIVPTVPSGTYTVSATAGASTPRRALTSIPSPPQKSSRS
jgi:hypothetical protein